MKINFEIEADKCDNEEGVTTLLAIEFMICNRYISFNIVLR